MIGEPRIEPCQGGLTGREFCITITFNRIAEAYVGEYASGKSETAINRAVALTKQGRRVCLVDLDVVEPFWTLRPLVKELETFGMKVVAWKPEEVQGFGETGTLLNPAAKWVLARKEDVIIDVGYGVSGAKVLRLLEGEAEYPYLQILAVINASRPMTATVEDIVAHVRSLGPVTGLINNTHLGEETDVAVVQEGARMVTEAAFSLKLPVIATTAVAEVARELGAVDCMGNPVRPLHRFMPRGFW